MVGFLPVWAALIGIGLAALWTLLWAIDAQDPAPVGLILLAAFLAIGT